MLLLSLVLAAAPARAIESGNDLPTFDIRLNDTQSRLQAASAISNAERVALEGDIRRLQAEVPDVTVSVHDSLGTPAFVRSTLHLLTAPAPQADAMDLLKEYIASYPGLFGVEVGVLDVCRVTRDYVTKHNGARHIALQQTINEYDLIGAELRANFTRDGAIINIASTLLPVAGKIPTENGMISAADGVKAAAKNIGNPVRSPLAEIATSGRGVARFSATPDFSGEPTARRAYFPVTRHSVRPVWIATIPEGGTANQYQVTIDAGSGTVLQRSNLTQYASTEDASYFVYPLESPTPDTGTMTRSLETLRYLDAVASPDGWMNDGDNSTIGNNVSTYTDTNDDNIPDPGSTPTGSPYRVFNFTMNLGLEPSTYRPASVTQLFYTCNIIHDRLYQVGFDEASGNFQENNFGRGGLGSDSVNAESQDGSGTNNANFSTPSDGSNPRMQMYIGVNTSPASDGVFDTHVVMHEYAHGLSNRLVGVGTLNTQQQMGEGWSDWIGLALLAKPGDDPAASHTVGNYLFGQGPGGPGIRPHPYSTNPAVNPHVFSDIGSGVSVPHGVGSVWCQILWVVRGKFLDKYGFAGNEIFLQLVVDGLKLTPPSPGFIEGRDAIIQADLVTNGGANLCELWTGFAERGLGLSAFSSSPNTLTVTNGFDMPENLCVNSTGTIDFDANAYSCSDSATVTVQDIDLAGAGSLSVTVTSSIGDSETLTLTEAPAASGIFSASIPTDELSVTPESGVLDVVNDATLYATYNDADDGTGSPAVVMATALADCLNPVISNVAVTGIAGVVAQVIFDTNETTTSTIHYGTSPGSLGLTANGGSATSHGVLLSGLTPQTTYYLTVEVLDGAGNVALDDNGGATYSFSTLDQADYFTEIFTGNDYDVIGQTLTFTPDGSGSLYSVCRDVATAFPTDPSGSSTLILSDDDFAQIALSQTVYLYGVGYTTMYVGSNGYITFGSGDYNYVESLEDHFNLPRISALFDDLYPPTGGTISWQERADRVIVTFEDVNEIGTSNLNSFQIQLFFDGRITLTHLNIDILDGIVGLSAGLGVPLDFSESDLTAYGACCSGQPDLVPNSFGLSGGNYAAPGEEVGARLAAAVRNIGDVNAGVLNVGFYLSTDPVITTSDTLLLGGRESVAGVNAGATVPVTIASTMAIPVGYPQGPAYLGVIVDELNVIAECSESNNTAVVPITIGTAPILRVETPTPLDVLLEVGETTTIDPGLIIYNDGAPGSVLAFSTSVNGIYPLALDSVTTEKITVRTPAVSAGRMTGTNAVVPEGYVSAARPAESYEIEFTPADSLVNSVLLLYADSDGPPSTLQSALAAFPDIDVVDAIDFTVAVPTLGQLAGYDVVVVMSNYPFADSIATGNVLADYVDGGGKVVVALAAFGSGGGAWELGGRFVTGGYEPFTHGPVDETGYTLGAHDTAHPIMSGVTSLTETLTAAVPSLVPGAIQVAAWNSGIPLVGTQGSSVVGINVFPFDYGSWTGDVPLLFHNAIVWLAGGGAPGWLSVEEPASGSIPGGSSEDRSVTFDATGLAVGIYDAQIVVISTNDPGQVSTKDVRLTVEDEGGIPDIRIQPDTLTFAPQATVDLYVEIDWMDGTGHTHRPSQTVLDRIVATFAQEGIAIHIDVSNAIPHQDFINLVSNPSNSPEVQAIRDANFDHAGDPLYYYSIWGHQYSISGSPTTSSGYADLPGGIHLVTLGAFPGQTGTENHQVGTFVHEFGHNLNQKHGGADHNHYKPQYVSVMGYYYQLGGIGATLLNLGLTNTSAGWNEFGYSHGNLAPLNENSLNESIGIGLGVAVDWNCDSDTTDTGLAQDLQGGSSSKRWCGATGPRTVISDYDNWSEIIAGISTGAFSPESISATNVDPCISFEEYAAFQSSFGSITSSPVDAQAGNNGNSQSLTSSQTFNVYNDGTSQLAVTSMGLDVAGPWITWLPSAPFNVPPGGVVPVTVTVDYALAPPGSSTRQIVVASNDPDENPYPTGVFVNVENTGDPCAPPSAPSNPTPADGEIEVPVTTDLSWNGGSVPGEGVIEDFENGDLSNYFEQSAGFSVISGAAHDGGFGIDIQSDGVNEIYWAYRDDEAVAVAPGNTISYWARFAPDATDGRIYCGFGATVAGTYSIVAALNSGELIIQLNNAYSYQSLAATPQAWAINHWYRLEVQWDAGGAMTGRLYDSDGVTLLNTVVANDTTFSGGGIAFRGFEHAHVDTVTRNGAPLALNLNRAAPPRLPRGEGKVVGWDEDNKAPVYEYAPAPFDASRRSTSSTLRDRESGGATLSAGYVFENGVAVEGQSSSALTSKSSSSGTVVPAGATLINFDDVSSPCSFIDTVRLIDEYAATGVIFAGPGGNDGGANLDECSTFSVSGYSSPNFLAFNNSVALSDGGIARGPETLYFDPPVSSVQVLAGSDSAGTVTMEAYNSGDELIGTDSLIGSSVMAPMGVEAPAITRVVISYSGSVLVVDDLVFMQEGGSACPPLYDVYFGTNPGAMALLCANSPSTTCNPGTLALGTTYYWQVVAKNSAGEAPGPVWSFTTTDSGPTPIGSWDFESGLAGFVIDNAYGNGNGLWHLTSACASASPGHTPVTALSYAVDAFCNYDAGLSEGVVTSPAIDLTNYSAPIGLTLSYYLETEGAPELYDMASVEVSVDGGGFTPVAHNDSAQAPVTLTDPSSAWLDATVDLSAMAGSVIQVRFHFNTLDSVGNEFAGFYVDDVVITGVQSDIAISHTAIADTVDPGPYSIDADVVALSTVDRADVFYSVDGGPLSQVAMANVGGNTYSVDIPAQAVGAVVCYYIEAEDTLGNIVTDPLGAPGNLHCFTRVGVPSLNLTCDAIDFVLAPDETDTVICTLSNDGDWPTSWSLTEISGGLPPFAVAALNGPKTKKMTYAPARTREQRIDWAPEHRPNTLLVGFQSGVNVAARDSVHAAAGTAVVHSYKYIPVDVVRIPDRANLRDVAASYASLAGVAYAEPNYELRADVLANDPSFPQLWGLHNTGQTGGTPDVDIDAPEAWDVQTGSASVIVADIDTGVEYTHPDLLANMWTNAVELAGTPGVDDDLNGIIDDIYGARWVDGTGVPSSGNPIDGHGHGTHTTGTIGALGNNAAGVTGVAWAVQLMALKFLDDSGFGSTADAISAVEYAVDMGAHLTSNSWGGGGFSQALKDAIEAAGAAGQLFVAAAGNDGLNTDISPHYPSSYDSANIISVANATHTGAKSGTSNYGVVSVDLAAPGAGILSTWLGGSYNTISGTSMATPHVSGVAALLLSVAPGTDPLVLKDWILNTVVPLPAFDPSGPTPVGTGGMLNAANALAASGIQWLDEAPKTGTLNPGESVEIEITADAAGLADGFTDNGDIVIKGDAGLPAPPADIVLPVSLTVASTPVCEIVVDSGPEGTPNPVESAGAVSMSVTAHDLAGGTLSYQWSASNGSFDDPTLQNPIWTAPEVCETNLNVEISVQIVSTLDCFVEPSFTQVVTAVPLAIYILDPPTTVPESVTCPDSVEGHVLAELSCGVGVVEYLWSDDCGGSFDDPTSGDPVWTPPLNETGSPFDCTLTVAMSAPGAATVEAYAVVTVEPCLDPPPCEIEVGSAAGSPGGSVVLPVVVNTVPNAVDALGVDVTFPSGLIYTGFERGSLTTSWQVFDANLIAAGVVRVGGLTFTAGTEIPVGGSGEIVLLHFNVDPNVPSGETQVVCLDNLADDVSGWVACCGEVSMVCRDGDVNGDCAITPGDALLAFQHYLQQIVLSECEQLHADVCDPQPVAAVTPGDALAMFQFYLGQPQDCIIEFPQACSCQEECLVP